MIFINLVACPVLSPVGIRNGIMIFIETEQLGSSAAAA
jgi:hypothetical protein